MPRRWPYCPPRRGRTTFSYMYLLLYQLNIQTPHTATPAFTRLRRQYKYPGSLNTLPPAQIDDFPPLTSRSSVSGPCTRVVSHCPIEIRSGRPDRSGISSSSYPAHAALHCSFAHNWTDSLQYHSTGFWYHRSVLQSQRPVPINY